jgi:hypothetical protein
MHLRRLACFVLGMWIAGSLFMTLVAIQNFRSVDRLLESPAPELSLQLDKLGRDTARTVFRHQVSEQNRWYFQFWEVVQLGLGAALVFLLLGTHSGKGTIALSSLMLAIAAAQYWALTPALVVLGRSIDWADRALPSGERNHFWTLHHAYSGMEVVKWLAGLLLAVRLLRRSPSKGHDDLRAEFEVVDEPHRHTG